MAPDRSARTAYNAFLSTGRGVFLYNSFKQILYGRQDTLASAISGLLFGCLGTFDRTRRVRVCDVGGGDGRRSVWILRDLNDRLGLKFDLEVVDQSPEMVALFDPAQLDEFSTGTSFCGRFEDLPLPPIYDLVLLIHSIFAFQDAHSLQRVLDLAGEEGTIVIISNSADSFLAGLKKLVDQNFSEKRFEVNNLKDALLTRGITFQESFFETHWTISDEHLEESIGTIVDWLSLDRRHPLSENQQRQIREYIQLNSSQGVLKRSFSEQEIILTIGGTCR